MLRIARRNSTTRVDKITQNILTILPCSIFTRHVLDARLLNPTGETSCALADGRRMDRQKIPGEIPMLLIPTFGR